MALKEQLEAAGYDTSSLDENAIMSQLEAAGYDTSPLVEKPQESKAKDFMRKVAKALPLTGAIGVPTIGAIASGGLSLPASAGLAGIGGAGGEAAKQLVLRALGDQEGVPQTATEAAADIGKTGLQDALLTLGGGMALKGAARAGRAVFAPSKEVVEATYAAKAAPLRAKAAQLAEEIAGRGDATVAQKKALESALKKSGEAIGEAEKRMGIFVDMLPEERAAELATAEGRDLFKRTIAEIAKGDPKKLAAIPAQERNILRKMSEQVLDVGDEGEKLVNVRFKEGVKRLGESLDAESPDFGAARSVYRVAKEELKALPETMRQRYSKLAQEKARIAGRIGELGAESAKAVSQAAKDAQLRRRLLLASLGLTGLGGAAKILQ